MVKRDVPLLFGLLRSLEMTKTLVDISYMGNFCWTTSILDSYLFIYLFICDSVGERPWPNVWDYSTYMVVAAHSLYFFTYDNFDFDFIIVSFEKRRRDKRLLFIYF